MSQMNIALTHECRCPDDEIEPRLRQLAESIQARWPVTLEPSADGWQLSGQGLNGSLTRQGRQVVVRLQLGLLLRAMAGRIEQGIRETLEEKL